jgi:hypothetical protein
MRKLFCLFFIVLLAVGCGPAGEPAASNQVPVATAETADTPTAADTVAPTADPLPADTAAPTAEIVPTDTTEAAEEEPAAETNDNFAPAATAEEAAVVRERDWVRGAADPQVTIIEYGDFQ